MDYGKLAIMIIIGIIGYQLWINRHSMFNLRRKGGERYDGVSNW